jgi:nicotinate-nucleotide adenylyltransferase
MVELACAGEPELRPSRIEEHRERSFSILTIEELRAARPGDEFSFLIGADAFAEIRTWFRWQDVIRAVPFLVVSRPGHTFEIPAGARVHRLDTLSMNVSSSEIRSSLARGVRPAELSAPVMDYIEQHRLYGFC